MVRAEKCHRHAQSIILKEEKTHHSNVGLPSADQVLAKLVLEPVQVWDANEKVRLVCPNDEVEAGVGQTFGRQNFGQTDDPFRLDRNFFGRLRSEDLDRSGVQPPEVLLGGARVKVLDVEKPVLLWRALV